MIRIRVLRPLSGVAFLSASFVACTTSSNPGGTGATGGPITGAADTHCSSTVTVNPAACTRSDAGAPADAAASDAASTDAATTDGGDKGDDYGVTLYNAEGDDDDCKYHVKWTATGIAKGSDATFNLVVTNKAGGSPVKMSPIRAEVFLDQTHPAPNSDQRAPESAAGTYAVGPIKFDASGQWTVRFHFHEECVDGADSPHGHVAFFVQVP